LNPIHLLSAVLYALLAWWQARRLAVAGPDAATPGVWRVAPLLPLAIHTWALGALMFEGGALHLGAGVALSAIAWLCVLIYGAGGLVWRLDGLQPPILFVGAMASLVAAWLPAGRAIANTGSVFFQSHVLMSIAAYSLFTIASVQALLMSAVERRLHSGTVSAGLRHVPPLMALESVLFRLIAAGFVLLTASLGSGMLFSEALFGQPLQFTHKIVFGILSWLIFGTLLAGRAWRGWRGRIAVRGTLAGFVVLLLAYVGSRFVLEVILQR
jgi:ABC-type uncharacterized transport system permease subunit